MVRAICGLDSQVVCELGLIRPVYSIIAASYPLATARSSGGDTSIFARGLTYRLVEKVRMTRQRGRQQTVYPEVHTKESSSWVRMVSSTYASE